MSACAHSLLIVALYYYQPQYLLINPKKKYGHVTAGFTSEHSQPWFIEVSAYQYLPWPNYSPYTNISHLPHKHAGWKTTFLLTWDRFRWHSFIFHPPSYYPLRVGGWNFVEKQGVPPKKGLYKMKSLGGHPTTKSEHRQTYVGTNFQEISRNPGLQNQNLAVRKSSCFFMFFTFASKTHIDVKWGWFCREVIL